MKPIRVFIVDDSAVIRQVLGEVIDNEHDMEVIGSAPDPILAWRKMNKSWPDVVLLDIVMPKMDGIAFLKQIMSERPTPTVICSTHTEHRPELTLEAMSSGAIEVIDKPQAQLTEFIHSPEVKQIFSALRKAAQVAVKPLKYTSEESFRQKHTADVILESKPPESLLAEGKLDHGKLLVIGASTGGTEALRILLTDLPMNMPPIVIVQHMPPKFTQAFAERLDSLTQHSVVEARDAQKVENSVVYIAPGDRHVTLQREGQQLYLNLKDGPMVSRHKPSVDVLFRSAAQAAGERAVGVILTGMGDDGAQGMLELKKAGAMTFAQDEESCLVYGMPKEAVAKGGVRAVCSLSALPSQITKALMDHE